MTKPYPGGKKSRAFISRKIRKLLKEGKSRQQHPQTQRRAGIIEQRQWNAFYCFEFHPVFKISTHRSDSAGIPNFA